jgi:hypothetical protein
MFPFSISDDRRKQGLTWSVSFFWFNLPLLMPESLSFMDPNSCKLSDNRLLILDVILFLLER